MAEEDAHGTGTYYWQRFIDSSGRWRRQQFLPPGEDLAAMRRGAGRDPGTVPSLWGHHTVQVREAHDDVTSEDWSPPRRFVAEHHALVLYGYHQQSQDQPVHREAVGLGSALQSLRASGRFSEEAVDRRVFAAFTATGLHELTTHLRGLISQMRTLRPAPSFDYSHLVRDLERWQLPEQQPRVRRGWAVQYELRARSKARPGTPPRRSTRDRTSTVRIEGEK